MEAWEKWWRMAQGSLTAAQVLEEQAEYRSSASRAYYAAYQAVTALLLYAKQTPPESREAWSHEATPDLVRNLPKAILTQTAQQGLSQRVADLYELRLVADYRADEDIGQATLREAVKSAAFVLKTLRFVLGEIKL